MVHIDIAKCTGCGYCVNVCPQGAIKIENNEAFVHRELCVECGTCVTVCPVNAIREVAPVYPRTLPMPYTPGYYKPAIKELGRGYASIRIYIRDCGRVSEFIVKTISRDENQSCPHCGSVYMKRLLSAPKLLKEDFNMLGHTCCGQTERCAAPLCSTDKGCQKH